MSSPKKNGARRAAPAEGGTPVRIFVKIGALKRFDALKRKTADLPVVVTWDRRRDERRDAEASPEAGHRATSPEAGRRASDRRRTPPFTWELADFVVAEDPAAVPAPAASSATPAGEPAPAPTRSASAKPPVGANSSADRKPSASPEPPTARRSRRR